MGVREKPIMAKRRARQFCAARPYSAGTSFRRARSPEAPKMTMVQGSAGEMELFLAESSISITALLLAVMFGPSLFRGCIAGVAAKLIAHRRLESPDAAAHRHAHKLKSRAFRPSPWRRVSP